MTTKTIKTYIVVGMSLVAIMIMSIGMMSINIDAIYAHATSRMTDVIPDDKILQRNWNDWKDKYTEDEFNMSENDAQLYIDDLKNNLSISNDWTKSLAKDLTVIHNFHTMMGVNQDYSQEILALIAAKQRSSDAYTADESVKRFHDWLISKYAVPSKVSEIDNRLNDLKYKEHASLVTQVTDAYTDAVSKGIVPYELLVQDPDYWGHVSFLSFCKLDENCSIDKTSTDAQTTYTSFNGKAVSTAYALVSYLNKMLEPQMAYAVTTHYITYFFWQFTPSNNCIDGLSCPITWYTSGTTGPVSHYYDSNGKHAKGASMTVYSVAYDQNNYQSSHNVQLNVTVDGYNVYYNCIASKTGTGYISTTKYCSIPGYNENTPWTFFINSSADVWST